jgi:hypothetical protein
MRFAAVIIGWMACAVALAAVPAEGKRVAVVVALNQPSAAVGPVSNAHEYAAALIERLGSKAGYSDVRALIGPAVTVGTVLETVRSAMRDAGPEGLVFFVFLGHGAGGDFGEPALLTHGASVNDPTGTGLDMAALTKALQPRADKQHVIAVIDAIHLGSIDGVALIGPTASDWPNLPATGMTVITPNIAGLGAGGPDLVPVVTDAIAGAADDDRDARVSLTEMFRYIGITMSDSSGSLVDTAGMLNSDRPLAVLAAQKVESQKSASSNMNGLSMGLLAGGGAAGVASLVMYMSKRSECTGQSGQLRCGEDAAYKRFQVTQHTLGWVGGGLVVAGMGLSLIPSPTGLMVQVGGRY